MDLVLGKSAKAEKKQGDEDSKEKNGDAAGKGRAEAAEVRTGQITVLGRPEVNYLLDVARAVCAAKPGVKEAKSAVEKKLGKDGLKNLKQLKHAAGLDAAIAHLESRAFAAPPMASLTPRRIGAEIELIPLEGPSGRRLPLEAENGLAVLPFLRRFAAREGWGEARTPKGVPCFVVRGGGTIGFEPGGQIEFSTPPARSLTAVLNRLRSVVIPLRAAAAAEGIELLSSGWPLVSISTRPRRLSSIAARRPATPLPITRKSASSNTRGRSWGPPTKSAGKSDRPLLVIPITVIPKARPRRATSFPMPPSPRTPSVAPRSCWLGISWSNT